MFLLVCYGFFYCLLSFVIVFIYCLLSFFSDGTDNEDSNLVESPVKRSIFKCNIQKIVPRPLQLRNMLSSRIEICS